jgi:hypothetical protein
MLQSPAWHPTRAPCLRVVWRHDDTQTMWEPSGENATLTRSFSCSAIDGPLPIPDDIPNTNGAVHCSRDDVSTIWRKKRCIKSDLEGNLSILRLIRPCKDRRVNIETTVSKSAGASVTVAVLWIWNCHALSEGNKYVEIWIFLTILVKFELNQGNIISALHLQQKGFSITQSTYLHSG